MNFSKSFIDRPIATALVMAAVLLAGMLAFTQLPVAAIPNMDFPTISVNANLPGANAETMASSVATPLERQFAQISGLTQMTSTSSLGSTNVTLQFDLNRNIDAAAQDVQAAISAAGGQLPKNLPNPPTYRKTNPSDQPIVAIAAVSDVLPLDQVHDYMDTRVAQSIAQISGVGQAGIPISQTPAIRVQIDPAAIANKNISLEDIRAVLVQSSVNAPKGSFHGNHQSSAIDSNDQLLKAEDYAKLVIAYRKGAPVTIGDVGKVVDGMENSQAAAWIDRHRGVVMGVFRQPGANVIETAEKVKEMLPKLIAAVPPAIHVYMMADRTVSIRASVRDIEITLLITIGLVIMVIFLFLRKIWATVIPGIAVPLSLVGAFGGMYLFGYTLDNLSLMALTIAVGFVVDDAIVMIENIVRYIEQGESPYQAAVKGSSQIGFTIVTITVSLIAVFIPLLLMSGIIGRLFHEFAMTVIVAVLVSSFVSLTLTPMMCARFLGHEEEHKGKFFQISERFFDWLVNSYARLLRVVLRHQALTLGSFIATIALTGALFLLIPKGFFPTQDTGFLQATTEGAQDVSFDELVRKSEQAINIILNDPDVASMASTLNGASGNTGIMLPNLKPFSERSSTGEEIINRLRPQLAKIPGFSVHMQTRQDINLGGRFSRTQYQYTLQDQDISELNYWAEVMLDKMKSIPVLQDVATDKQSSAPRTIVKVDRATASKLGIMQQQIDDTLYDAFGQRQVGTMFTQLNQYRVILEVDPQFQTSAEALNKIYVKSTNGTQVPLSSFASFEQSSWALSVSHQGQYPAVTLSFNLAPGVALGDAVAQIQKAQTDVRLPISVVPNFQGTAQAFQASLVTMPYLIMAALIVVYIVLGILYESFVHPLTILSTIPSAGVGALLMLWLFGYPLDLIGLIGIILLIGIVMKNAIMMIDFALEGERKQNMSPEDAIYHAALLRFRPIMMTTMTTLFSGLPLMLSTGPGAEFRSPLGFAIVGGLLLSQALTLFTTPVVYLYLDRFSNWLMRGRKAAIRRATSAALPLPAAE